MLLVTVTFVAEEPPNVTVAPETKLVPAMVTEVPPATGPEVGVTLVTVGAGAGGGVEKVKPFKIVPLWPSGFVTTTLTAPAAWAGVTAVIVVLFVTETFVAEAPPKETVAPGTKPVPVIVTDVPPFVVPLFGEIEDTVGAGVPNPPDSVRIVVSFLSAPGAELR